MISLLLLLTACLPDFPAWQGGGDDTGPFGDGGVETDGGSDGGTESDGGSDGGSPEDGGSDGGSSTTGDGDEDGWTIAQGDCDDTDPKVNPGVKAEICNNGVDDDCNDSPDDCVLAGSYSSADAVATRTGATASGYLGAAVIGLEGAGSDGGEAGTDRLVVGAPWDRGGRVFLFEGPLAGTESADLGWQTDLVGAQPGQDLAVGDLDGDGHQDLLITGHQAIQAGAPLTATEGALLWMLPGPVGSSGTLDDGAIRVSEGTVATFYASTFVDGPAVLDDSGIARGVALSAITHPTGDRLTTLGGGPGAVYIFDAAELTDTPGSYELPRSTIQLDGNDSDRLGSDIAWVDLDGDGTDDLVIGAEGYENDDGNDEGRVFVMMNTDAGAFPEGHPNDTATRVITPGSGTAMLGYAVHNVGDFDGDGLEDFAVGAPGSDFGAWGTGEAAVFTGPTLVASDRTLTTMDADLRAEGWDSGTAVGGRLGSSLGRPGDLDDDGCAEVLVGAPYTNSSGTTGARSGAAFVLAGCTTGSVTPSPDTATTFLGPTSSDFGTALGTGTDFTGDGVDDLVITGWNYSAAIGGAWVFEGRSY